RQQAGVREALQRGRDGRGDEAGAGGEQPAGLPPAVGEGAQGDRRQRDVAGRSPGAGAAPGATRAVSSRRAPCELAEENWRAGGLTSPGVLCTSGGLTSPGSPLTPPARP